MFRISILLGLFGIGVSLQAQTEELPGILKGKIIRSACSSPYEQNTFYAGLKGDTLGSGFIYRSRDAGNSWAIINKGQSIGPYVADIQAIAVGGKKGNLVYCGTWKQGLFVSHNEGGSWSHLDQFPSSDVRSIAVHPANSRVVYAATSNMGVVTSRDNGNSWFTCPPAALNRTFRFAWSVEADPADEHSAYALTFGQGLFKTSDHGRNWNQVLPTPDMVCWDMQISDDGQAIWLAASKRGDTTSSVFQSNDSGSTWEELKNVPQIGICQIFVLGKGEQQMLFLGGWQGGLYAYLNAQWKHLPEIDFPTISGILDASKTLLVPTWGNGIYNYPKTLLKSK